MKIKISTLAISMLVIIFGGILIASVLGVWGSKSELEQINARYDGMDAGLDPAQIRGSFSFAEVSEFFGIPLDVLAEAFMLPETVDPQYFYNRDMEALFGAVLTEDQEIGNSAVQYFVALYTGLPYQQSEEMYLPQAAVDILKAQAELTDEQIAYLDAHTVQIDPGDLLAALGTDGEEEHDQNEAVVKGTTTFYDVLNWGVTETDLMAVLNGEMPPTNILIRDYCTQVGLEYGIVKAELQLLVDAAR